VAAGAMWAPAWAVPLNAATVVANRPYVSSFAGFDRPWAELEQRLPGVLVQRLAVDEDIGTAAGGRCRREVAVVTRADISLAMGLGHDHFSIGIDPSV
jgi:hypothetical protein